MKVNRRSRISVEHLEERDCPSLTISLSGSNLYIFGTPTAGSTLATTGGVQVNETKSNTFAVTNAGHTLGTYVASSVTLNLTNHTQTSINVNLMGNTMSGNLAIGLGTGDGDSTGAITDGVGVFGGTIAGGLTITGGGGTETVELGQNTASAAAANLMVLGNVSVTGKALPGSVGNELDTGFNTGLNPTDFIGGNLTTSAYNGVFLGKNSTVGGSFSANGNGVPFNNNSLSEAVLILGRVGGNATVTGTAGSTGDNVFLTDGTSAASIGGNFSANLGNGANSVGLAGTLNNVNVTAGNGANTLITGGFVGLGGPVALNVNNNLSFLLGSGNNTFTDATTSAAGISSNTTVGGTLSITAGNGTNNLGTVASTENTNLNVTLGNGGTNITPQAMTLTGPVQGTFTYHTGNGTNTLTINGPATATALQYNVNVLFGSGVDTFGFGNGTSTVTLTGQVVANPSSGLNTFNQGPNGIIGSPWFLSGF